MDIIEKLEYAEKIFQSFLSKKANESTFCKDISSVFSSFDKNNYEVLISNANQKEPFFGMRVFPAISKDGSESSLYDMELNTLLAVNTDTTTKISFDKCYKFWKENTNWVIEIDQSALDHHKINLNPKELVSMILHEIGHVVYGDRVLERIYNAFREMKAIQSTAVKYTMSGATFLCYPVIIAACKYRNWVVGKDEIKAEFFADKYAVEYGYGEHLSNAFEKIVKYFGRTDNHDNVNVETEAKWSADLATKLMARHNRVRDEIYIKAARSSSKYIQTIYRLMLSKLGIVSKNRYSGSIESNLPAIESLFAADFIEHNELFENMQASMITNNIVHIANQKAERAMEAFGKKSKKQYEKEISDISYAIDSITIEVDKITSHHDRKYVLDLIYDVREDIGEWEERLNQFPHLKSKYGERLKTFKDTLESLTRAVLDKKNFGSRYSVFVKYPAGYEG